MGHDCDCFTGHCTDYDLLSAIADHFLLIRMMAKAFGMNVQVYHYLLMLLLTLVSVTAMQSVGTILIVALLVTPAATAYLFTKRLSHMMVIAGILSGASSVIGLFIGYSFNIAAGSSIVLTAAVLFVLGFSFHQNNKRVLPNAG